ncbi:hypothetical protein IGI37_003218 [Enterococcus sp. AZ194]|uniref:hypothetical protein n=1 Tax=Enterococcus sp. AZ194 TaxID=2774629 RepID=UPI003F23C626
MEKKNIEQLEKQIKRVPVETKESHLFLSISNGKERANVKNVRAVNREEGLKWLKEQLVSLDSTTPHIRVDIVTRCQELSYGALMRKLAIVPRNNYFRLGLAFNRKFSIAFLSEELLGNAILKPTKDHVVGFNSPNLQINEQNLQGYMKRKYNRSLTQKLTQKTFIVFETQGFYLEGDNWVMLSTQKEKEGIRESTLQLFPERVHQGIAQGEAFLNKQIQASGQFIYGYYPTYDFMITGYNSVRHFSSVYALLEAQEYLGLSEELANSEKALDWGLQHLTLKDNEALFIKEENKNGTSLKLGAQALAILAMAKFQTITGNDKYEATINALILGMEERFVSPEGETTHVLDEQLHLKKKFNIIYYDGEAVFSILRGYAITKNPRHLALAKKLFDRFVEKNYEKYHDHWLSYATNEILLYVDEKAYYEFGLKNAFENMRFIEQRDTAYPTLLELLMAAIKMTDKLKETSYYGNNELTHFISTIDFWRLKQAATKRATIEIEKGVMYPELGMYMKRPDKIIHGFYTRHDKFRMRIDDQEHFLSGLINYYGYFYKADEKLKKGVHTYE